MSLVKDSLASHVLNQAVVGLEPRVQGQGAASTSRWFSDDKFIIEIPRQAFLE